MATSKHLQQNGGCVPVGWQHAATQTDSPSCCAAVLSQLQAVQQELARTRTKLQGALDTRPAVESATTQTEILSRHHALSSSKEAISVFAREPSRTALCQDTPPSHQEKCSVELVTVSCKPEVFDVETGSSNDESSGLESPSELAEHLPQFTADHGHMTPLDFVSVSCAVKVKSAAKSQQETVSSRLNSSCTEQEQARKTDASQPATPSAPQPSWSGPSSRPQTSVSTHQQVPGRPPSAQLVPVKEEFVDINDFQFSASGSQTGRVSSATTAPSGKSNENSAPASSSPIIPLFDLTALCRTVSNFSGASGAGYNPSGQEGAERSNSLQIPGQVSAGPVLPPGLEIEASPVDGSLVAGVLDIGLPTGYRRRRRLQPPVSGLGQPQPGRPHCCPLCGRAFASLWHLQRHRLSHTGERPHRCRTCGRAFSRPEHLRRHMMRHTGERPYSCELCGRSFSQRESVTLHMRTHTGPRHYTCASCGLIFQQHAEYIEHKRTHPGERSLECEVCGRSFSQQTALVEHRRIHTGERPLSCGYCGRSFRQNSALKRHERLHVAQRTDGTRHLTQRMWASASGLPADASTAAMPSQLELQGGHRSSATVQLNPSLAASVSFYKQ